MPKAKTGSSKKAKKLICSWCGSGDTARVGDVDRETISCSVCGSVIRGKPGMVAVSDVTGFVSVLEDGTTLVDSIVRQRNIFLGNGNVLDNALSGEMVLVYGEIGGYVSGAFTGRGWNVSATSELRGAREESDIIVAPNASQSVSLREDIDGMLSLLKGGGFLILVMEGPSEEKILHESLANFMIPSEVFIEHSGLMGRARVIPMNSGEYAVWIR
jgi:hypothetical protein